MRRLVTGAALALAITLAFVPLCAHADTIETVDIARAVSARFTFPHFEQPAKPRPLPVRVIVYALQAFDAAQTAAALRRAPEQVRDGANAAQALANIDGLLNTRRALLAP